jgi:hypothetical protein
LIAIVALTVGVGFAVDTASAAADAPSTASSIGFVSGGTPAPTATDDWWW